MSGLILPVVALLAGAGLLLVLHLLGRYRLRQHAIGQVLDAADALEARLRTARGEIEAIAGDQVNPVRAAMQDLLQQRLWLQDNAQRASLPQLANVHQTLDRARAQLDQQLQRIAQARGEE
ncbi:MAG: hypothetical protein KGL91_02030 [Xanthomonadaceae bacterium]|nr:hypothetical protein [Xanthomonadaceae bacterium]